MSDHSHPGGHVPLAHAVVSGRIVEVAAGDEPTASGTGNAD